MTDLLRFKGYCVVCADDLEDRVDDTCSRKCADLARLKQRFEQAKDSLTEGEQLKQSNALSRSIATRQSAKAIELGFRDRFHLLNSRNGEAHEAEKAARGKTFGTKKGYRPTAKV